MWRKDKLESVQSVRFYRVREKGKEGRIEQEAITRGRKNKVSKCNIVLTQFCISFTDPN